MAEIETRKSLVIIAVLIGFVIGCTPTPSVSEQEADLRPSETITPIPLPSLTYTASPTSSPEPTLTWTSVPPSPTRQPTNTPTLAPAFSSLQIAYTDQSLLWHWQGGVAKPLMEIENYYSSIDLSPDGKQVAYATSLEVGVINTDGSNRRVLIDPDDLMTILAYGFEDIPFLDWVPGQPRLMLTTISTGGPAYYPHDDLYIIDVETGEWEQVFAPGEGGQVHFSPDGKYAAVVSREHLIMMKSDGSWWKTALTYQPARIPTDVAVYPEMLWAKDSKSILIIIPSEDAYYDPAAPTTIYRVFIDGSSLVVLNKHLGSKNISPDLTKYAYNVNKQSENNGQNELHIANLDGTGDQIYFTSDEYLSYLGWAPDGMSFFFLSEGLNQLGILNLDNNREVVTQDLVLLDAFAAERYYDYIWLGDDRFIVLTSDGVWIGSAGETGQRIIELSEIDWRLFEFIK